MRLPNREQAIISEHKITEYLLSVSHPYGRHKAAFFMSFGFSTESWRLMASSLLAHAGEYDVTDMDDTEFGTRYTVEGSLRTPDGRRPIVRVVWFVDKGDNRPRLVTAYPVGGSIS